jgi:hypothetical protein
MFDVGIFFLDAQCHAVWHICRWKITIQCMLCFTVHGCSSLASQCFTVLHCASLCFTVLHCASLSFNELHCTVHLTNYQLTKIELLFIKEIHLEVLQEPHRLAVHMNLQILVLLVGMMTVLSSVLLCQ